MTPRALSLLIPPYPPGPGGCATCHGPTQADAHLCRSCSRLPGLLDVVLPISLSGAGSPLARHLRAYKDDPCADARDQGIRVLAYVLARFLAAHERCLAAAAGADRFDITCTIPARSGAGGGRLELLVARRCAITSGRYARLLEPGPDYGAARTWSPGRYRARRRLAGETVLVIDDTWTSGASAQASAHALRQAGAGVVALVVIGRHLQRSDRARAGGAFEWGRCALGPSCQGNFPVPPATARSGRLAGRVQE